MLKGKLSKKYLKKTESENVENYEQKKESIDEKRVKTESTGNSETNNGTSIIMMKLNGKTRKVGVFSGEKDENLNIFSKISSEFTCPICLDYYTLPVTIPCGHTFCRYCITHNRLLGKTCPVCRQPIGYNFRTNMAIHNVIMLLGMTKFVDNGAIEDVNIESLFLSNKVLSGQYRPKWWQLCFCKPVISVTLFGRIIADEILGIGIIFAEDLTRCIIDRLSKLSSISNDANFKNYIWSNGIYMIGPFEIQLLTKWIGCPPLPFDEFDENTDNTDQNPDFILNNNITFKNQVKQWVEGCVAMKPTILNIGQTPFIKTSTYPIIRILSDRIHRVESKMYDLGSLRSPLPWDLGRHSKSTIQIPHSSVSTNHLLIVNIKEHNQAAKELNNTKNNLIFEDTDFLDNEIEGSIGRDWGIGIIDLGSSIGTMLKIQSRHQLASEETIHLADRVEITVKIRLISELDVEDNNYLHRNNLLLIREWKKLRWSNKLNLVVNIDEYNNSSEKNKQEIVEDSVEESLNNEKIEVISSSLCENRAQENKITQIPIEELELEEINQYLEVYIPIVSHDLIPCEGAEKTEDGKFWSIIIHPSGMVFGRGKCGALGLKKVEVTENNGYISREHCIFYYSSTKFDFSNKNDYLNRPKESLSSWYVKDISTSGTFLRLKPFSYPLRLMPGMALKVGQCKMEILPYMLGTLYSSSTNNINTFSLPVNFFSRESRQTNSNSPDSELLETDQNMNNQIPSSILGNSHIYTQLLSSPYFTNINSNVITQMNFLMAYNYINTSSITNFINSNTVNDFNAPLIEGSFRQLHSLSNNPFINNERSSFENVFLQTILNNTNYNNSNIDQTIDNSQNEEERFPNSENLVNYSLQIDELNFERRPREPRVTQEGDISFN